MSKPEGQKIFKDVHKEEETPSGRLARKSKEFPFMPIGLTGAVMGCLYGAYKYRTRGDMSTSIFLIHLRVAAQGTVVSALTLGIAYSLIRDFLNPTPYEPPKPKEPAYRPTPHPKQDTVSPNYEKTKEK